MKSLRGERAAEKGLLILTKSKRILPKGLKAVDIAGLMCQGLKP